MRYVEILEDVADIMHNVNLCGGKLPVEFVLEAGFKGDKLRFAAAMLAGITNGLLLFTSDFDILLTKKGKTVIAQAEAELEAEQAERNKAKQPTFEPKLTEPRCSCEHCLDTIANNNNVSNN